MLIEDRGIRKSFNCYSGNICYLLECRDVLLSEHMSFGLSGGLTVQFMISDKIEFRGVRELHCLTEYIYKLGVIILTMSLKNFEDFNESLMLMIEKNLPLMFDYDGYFVPFTQIYKKKHEKRIGLLTGYDKDGFYISDFIYGVHNMKISTDVLRCAVDKELGACVDFVYYDVEFPKGINDKVTRQSIWRTINEVIKHFTEESKSDERKMVGVEGLYKFAAVFVDIKNMVEKKQLQINWLEFSEDIKQLIITLEMYSLFLKDIVNKKMVESCMHETLLHSSELIKSASEKWRIVCGLFFKLGINANEKLEDRIKNNIIKTADALYNAFENIKKEEKDKGLCTF